jgi:CRISPR type I-E-associated protein CasB/Cse2
METDEKQGKPGKYGHDSSVEEFVKHLEELDVGARARLRRNAGMKLEESRNVLGLFYRLLSPIVPERNQWAYFLVATLYPIAESGHSDNFGATLRMAQNENNSAGLDRRVETLLDSDQEQLIFRLRQAVQFAKSNRVPVNWRQLLLDLLQWEHPTRYVQRKWAEAYFGEARGKGTSNDKDGDSKRNGKTGLRPNKKQLTKET